MAIFRLNLSRFYVIYAQAFIKRGFVHQLDLSMRRFNRLIQMIISIMAFTIFAQPGEIHFFPKKISAVQGIEAKVTVSFSLSIATAKCQWSKWFSRCVKACPPEVLSISRNNPSWKPILNLSFIFPP